MSELRIAIRHVLPNTMAPLIVLATAQLGSAILVEASLSFLGLGIPEPYPSWGRMLSESAAEYVRANDISMIFQEPLTSLNPVLTVGGQIAEAIELHQDLGKSAAMEKAVNMLALVKIPEPAQRAREYPHQMSGGMRQRAMIAMA